MKTFTNTRTGLTGGVEACLFRWLITRALSYFARTLEESVKHVKSVLYYLMWCAVQPMTDARLLQLVELKNGETYNGILVNCDIWMNLSLRDVVCTSRVRAPILVYQWCMIDLIPKLTGGEMYGVTVLDRDPWWIWFWDILRPCREWVCPFSLAWNVLTRCLIWKMKGSLWFFWANFPEGWHCFGVHRRWECKALSKWPPNNESRAVSFRAACTQIHIVVMIR